MDRRTAIKWVLFAGVAAQLPDFVRAAALAPGSDPAVPGGYGQDPDLLKEYKAGDLWPLTLTEAQKRKASALCDLIIPADEHSPSASSLAVPVFIDEWISAPYPDCRSDRDLIVKGLDALGAEVAIPSEPTPFFERFRMLTAMGYYTTPVGMKALGYVGNVPLPRFDGPPLEVLKRVGLA